MLRYLITAFMALALLVPAGVQAATVTFSSADANGTVTGTTPQTIAQGQSGTAVTAVPNANYHFYRWTWTDPAGPDPFGSVDNPLIFKAGAEATDDVKANFAFNLSQSVLVHGVSNIVDIRGGRSHTVALTSNGSVLEWGANGDKQGDIATFGLKGAKAIATGPYNTLAIDATANLVGSGTWTSSDATVPNVIFDKNSQAPLAPVNTAATGIGIKAIAAGNAHALALLNDNSLAAAGDNADGQVALPPALLTSVLTAQNHPVVEAIAAGHFHSVALLKMPDNSKKIVAWGRRFEGQLGDGLVLPGVTVNCVHFDYPNNNRTPVAGETSYCEITGVDAVAVDARGYHTVALTSGGKVVAFGSNDRGQGTVPTNLAFGSNSPVQAKAIAAGAHHTVVLLTDNTVQAWGDNGYGEINIPTGLGPITKVAAGSYHTMLLEGNSAVLLFGDNEGGQCELPALPVNPTAPEDGDFSPVTNGTVACNATDNSGMTTSVAYGGATKCDLTPAAGANLTVFNVNGVPTTVTNNTITFSGVTKPLSITAVFAAKPAAPTAVTAAAADASATVSFTAPNDNGSPITGYTATSTPGGKTGTGTTSPITVSGLTNGTSYTFTVTATNAIGTSAPSAASNSVTPNGSGSVVLSNLNQTFTGSPLTPTATTTPPNLTVVWTGAPQTNAGSYPVVANIQDASFSGSAAGTFVIAPANQTITVGTQAPANKAFNQSFNVAATSSFNLPVAITSSGACSGSGSGTATITMTSGTGTCTVSYAQTGNSNVNAAPVVTETTTAQKAAQTITFGAISGRTLGGGGFTLSATSDSGLPVSFASTTGAVCTVSGNALSVAGTGTCSVDATQAGDNNFAAAAPVTRSFLITAGVLDHFQVSAPASATVGTPFSVTVTAVDSAGFPVTTYNGFANLSTDHGNILPNFIGFTNGTWTGQATMSNAGTGQNISVSDGVKSGSTTLDLLPGPAVTFSVVAPASTDAGAPINITVTARDSFNNVATGYTGTIRFTTTDSAASGQAQYTFLASDNGSKVFSGTLNTVGVQTVTVTDTATSSITGTSNSVTVSPAGPAKFLVTASATTGAGTAFPVTVTVKDNFGNTITDYTGTVHFTSTDSNAVLPADYTFVVADGGSHTFNGVVLKGAPTQAISATDTGNNSINGTSGSVQVVAGAAAGLAFGQQPGTTTAGQALAPPVTVRVVDQFGNTVTSSSADITVAIATNPGNATLAGTTTQTAQSGVATFNNLSLDRNASGYTLSATSAGLTAATSNAFDIGTGALSKFTIAPVGTQVIGVAFPITVTAQDAAGNTVSTFTGTVDLSGTGATVTPATSANFTNGVWTGSVTVASAATGMTLTATQTGGTAAGTSNAFDVTKGAQTISTGSIPLVAPFQGTFDVTATSSATLPVTIVTSGACSGGGTGSATITIISGSGTCTITFDAAGNNQFNAAPTVVAHVTAGKIQQAIVVDTAAPTSAQFGTTFTVAAHAPGGTVTYGSSGGCTNSGATFTMTSATQACTVTYSQAGSDIYFAAETSTSTTAAAALPGAPSIFSVTAANGQATIVFNAPVQTGGSPITGYTVTANPGNITASGTNSPITITGLSNGTSYTFSVAATNAAGTGPAAVSDAKTPVATGDLNGDGVVDIRDAMLALRIATGIQVATSAQLAAGDVAPLVNNAPSPDGKIDVGDVIVLLRKAVGQVNF